MLVPPPRPPPADLSSYFQMNTACAARAESAGRSMRRCAAPLSVRSSPQAAPPPLSPLRTRPPQAPAEDGIEDGIRNQKDPTRATEAAGDCEEM